MSTVHPSATSHLHGTPAFLYYLRHYSLLDWLLLIMLYLFSMYYNMKTPYHRIITDYNDPRIHYPLKEQTVPGNLLWMLSFFLPLSILCIIFIIRLIILYRRAWIFAASAVSSTTAVTTTVATTTVASSSPTSNHSMHSSSTMSPKSIWSLFLQETNIYTEGRTMLFAFGLAFVLTLNATTILKKVSWRTHTCIRTYIHTYVHTYVLSKQ